MKQKGFSFTNVMLAVSVVVLLLAVGGYFAWYKKSVSNVQDTSQTQTQNTIPSTNSVPTSKIYSESEILTSLKNNWTSVQASLPFRPGWPPGAQIWFSSGSVQFVGKNSLLVGFEDGHTSHLVILNFNNDEFKILEILKNQSSFSLSDWNKLVSKYGDPSYVVSSYSVNAIKDNKIISFPDLTKVSENVFVRNY